MLKKNVLNSPRLLELKKHRRRAVWNKILIFFLGLGVIFASLAYLFHLDSLNISEIQIVGNKVIETETLQQTVTEQIAGKYLYFFPKTNILFYPQNNIKNELQNKFKRLKDINLAVKNKRTLEVNLSEREAKYTWCGKTLPLLDKGRVGEGSEKCYFTDEDGFIFDEAPYFSGEVYFKFYGLVSESYFSKSNFQQLISLKDTLVGIGLQPVILYVKDNGEMEVFLSKGASAETNPRIIFKIDSDFQKVAENLQAALLAEPLLSEFKNKYSALQYIDLRFGNKIYYKFSAQGAPIGGQ